MEEGLQDVILIGIVETFIVLCEQKSLMTQIIQKKNSATICINRIAHKLEHSAKRRVENVLIRLYHTLQPANQDTNVHHLVNLLII